MLIPCLGQQYLLLEMAVKRYPFGLKKSTIRIGEKDLERLFAFEPKLPLFRTVIRKVTVMNNVRFATTLHILTLLHLKSGELLPSEYIRSEEHTSELQSQS